MDEIKPVFTMKREFEKRYLSKKLQVIGEFRQSGSSCEEQNQQVFMDMVGHMLQVINWDLDGTFRAKT